MDTTPPIPHECREWWRFRTLCLKGRHQRGIAKAFDVAEVSVGHWSAEARGAPGSPRT
ncbi:hypothetical protein [Singulisphaera sp. PoT]|uniref:hypothetical protein n=1 Tax=Singulisphaera sp. PoT TaxID=3411797 RepID=UPI003BF475AA